MPKTLADGRILLIALTTRPENPAVPTVAELKAGKKISCGILKSDYQLGATGNAEISEQEMCKKGEGKVPGPASYEGNVTVFLCMDDDGKLIVVENPAWEALKATGTELYLYEREGPLEGVEIKAGDVVSGYEVITFTPTKPSDRFAGYIKRTIKLGVTNAWEDVAVAA